MTIASQANALRLAAPLGRTEAMTVRGVSVYGVSGRRARVSRQDSK